MAIEALERLGEHLNTLGAEDRAAWKQAIYFLHLLVFHKRSGEEREVLEQILSEHQGTFGLTKQETALMQTLAEQYLQQGIEQGAVDAKREAVLKLLEHQFGSVPQSIANHITQLRHISQLDALFESAMQAKSLEDIQI